MAQDISKAIIFGANGQDGYYLSQLLKNKGIEFIGISRNGNHVKGNVSDYDFVQQQIKDYQPSHIFHLAASSTTQHHALFDNHHAISTGTLNILESVRLYCKNARVFLSGSAMQFKNEGIPIDEHTPFEASSPYSVARIHSVYAARYYRNKFGLKIYVGYFFNHDSPLRSEHHVNQMIISAVKRIKAGNNEKLALGDIEVQKEFNYAGDIINAVWLMINQDVYYEVVIGSGKAYRIKDWLEYCFNSIDKQWQEYVVNQPSFQSEYKILSCNPTLINSLGWAPNVSFHELADMMIKHE